MKYKSPKLYNLAQPATIDRNAIENNNACTNYGSVCGLGSGAGSCGWGISGG